MSKVDQVINCSMIMSLGVFWLNIAKNEVYLWSYGHYLNLFGKMRREADFGNGVAKILRKSMREEREIMRRERERENWISMM